MSEHDLETTLRRIAETKVNRRGFLAATGLTATSAFLAACASGGSASTAPESAAPASAAPPPSAAPSAAASAEASAAASAAVYEHTGVEPELFMYNWSNYISDANIEAFKAEYGLTKFQYDIYANNEELIAKLQGGASGYDIAAPTAEYVPGMVQEGFLEKLDLTKIPNVANIAATFKNLWWDPTNEYQVPKDYGTTGVLYRSTMIPTIPKSWKEFYDLVKGAGSGQDDLRRLDGRRVRLPAQDAGLLAQLGRAGASSRRRARSCSTSLRTSWRSTPTSTARRWPTAKRR